ncbi:hypothetical protein LK994_08785 [Ferruginibacter lapsinanis]|uniref:hypothetical protein n=1 Tax=Ferruginibacter lapsinanis TaxID=563172 RepID=UPI001E45B8CE|nr:hypothetical protein [Ferruginibacter lapsinanis]UEG48731.1 hypothetical protein LK994_08785 [Ferruginibacter lapsinanis]
MKKGLERFDFYLNQLLVLIAKASKQKNPALWLYQNNARTPVFMLEGLSKLYIDIHDKKKFTALKEQFKLLEDGFGQIDYYDAFAKEFAKNKKIPTVVTNYLQAQTREKIQHLNELLIEENWLTLENNRISKIQKKLSSADWLKEKKDIIAINKFYGKAIYEIVEFVHSTKFHFDNVEADVHELRRKLRWLSIYPQALRGSIQLVKPIQSPTHLTKYLTKEITSSPFNTMPDAGDNNCFLLLNQHYFYALSWMIAELGKIKDNGLRVIAIKEALQQTSPITEAEAYKKAYQFLGTKQPKLQTLLDNAETICKTYFTEMNLEHLVTGIRETN